MSGKKIISLKVPDIGDSDLIKLVKWHKKEGDVFEKGEDLCDLTSDKAVFSLEAPQEGKLKHIYIHSPGKVSVGQVLAKAEV